MRISTTNPQKIRIIKHQPNTPQNLSESSPSDQSLINLMNVLFVYFSPTPINHKPQVLTIGQQMTTTGAEALADNLTYHQFYF